MDFTQGNLNGGCGILGLSHFDTVYCEKVFFLFVRVLWKPNRGSIKQVVALFGRPIVPPASSVTREFESIIQDDSSGPAASRAALTW